LEAESNPGPNAAGRIRQIENSSDLKVNRTTFYNGMINECGALGGMRIGKGNRSTP
jgi:hypothetical protein